MRAPVRQLLLSQSDIQRLRSAIGAAEGEIFDVARSLNLGEMWEDTARTTQSSMNGVVGSIRGVLGRYYAEQSTGAAKPILRGTPAGPDLVSNGTFASDTVWNKGAGWSIGSGVATGTAAATSLTQAVAFTAGHVYRLTFTVTAYTSGSVTPRLTGGSTVTGTARTATGTYESHLTALSGNDTLGFLGTAFTGSIDNVSLYDVTAGQVVAPYWLESDGTKYLSFTMATAVDGVLALAACRRDASPASAEILSNRASSIDDTSGQWGLQSISTTNYRFVIRVAGGTNGPTMGFSPAEGTDTIFDGTYDASQPRVAVAVNGVSGGAIAATKVGSNKEITLLARSSVGANPWTGRLYCALIAGINPSGSQLALARQWAASRSGVTL